LIALLPDGRFIAFDDWDRNRLTEPDDVLTGLFAEYEKYDGFYGHFNYWGYNNWFQGRSNIMLPKAFNARPRPVIEGSTENPVYIKAVETALNEKGIYGMPIILNRVIEVDLDGNGNIEVLISADNEAAPDVLAIDSSTDIPYTPGMAQYRLIVLLDSTGKTHEVFWDYRPVFRDASGELMYYDSPDLLQEIGAESVNSLWLYDRDGSMTAVPLLGIGEFWDYTAMNWFDRIFTVIDIDNDGNMEFIYYTANYYGSFHIYRWQDMYLRRIFSCYASWA
jgi:hypothetical protein